MNSKPESTRFPSVEPLSSALCNCGLVRTDGNLLDGNQPNCIPPQDIKFNQFLTFVKIIFGGNLAFRLSTY